MSERSIRMLHGRTSMVGRSAQRAADHAKTDLPALIAFSLIGLLLALDVMLRFPELGALITQYNRF